MLELNKTKTCFWHRLDPGSYCLGDIRVDRFWHSEGPCAGNYMWHVIVDGRTVVTWAYLKNAKDTAYKIDREADKINSMEQLIKIVETT